MVPPTVVDFNIHFIQVGLLFVILGAVIFVIAFFRARHCSHDFADRHKEAQILDSGIKTQGQEGTRIYGRPFVTAGWTVVQVTVAVAVCELGLLGLIIRQVRFHSCVHGLYLLYCHRPKILQYLVHVSRMIICINYSIFSNFKVQPRATAKIQCKRKKISLLSGSKAAN
jgi:hypothetical protein